MKIKKLWLAIGIGTVLDLIFFYVLTRLHLEVLTKVAIEMQSINEILAQKTAEFAQTQSANVNTYLLATPEFMQHYHAVLKYAALFAVGTFLAWVVLQGIAWYLAQRSTGRHVPLLPYLGRFSIISIAGAALMIGVLFIVLGLAESGAVLPLFSENEPIIASVILTLVIGYFAVVLYSAPTLRGLRASLTHANPLALLYLGMLALTALGVALGTWLFTVHWGALLVFSLFILLPSLSYYRYVYARFMLQHTIF